MRSKLLQEGTERSFAIVFNEGEEPARGLLEFCNQQKVAAAHFTAIGALKAVTLGWFNMDTNDYERVRIEEQVEVLSLVGNVALYEGRPKVHAHLVVGKRDGAALGGHLLDGIVRPTLEVMLDESPRHLRRVFDSKTGLALIDPDASTPPNRQGRDGSGETTDTG